LAQGPQARQRSEQPDQAVVQPGRRARGGRGAADDLGGGDDDGGARLRTVPEVAAGGAVAARRVRRGVQRRPELRVGLGRARTAAKFKG